MGEWQPIETAPRDGKDILAVRGQWQPCIVRWMTIKGESKWTPDPEGFCADEHFFAHWETTRYEPTHWMPLPRHRSPTKPADSEMVERAARPAADPAARRLVEVEQRFLMMCTKHAHSAYCEDVAWLLTERRRLVRELEEANDRALSAECDLRDVS